MQKWFLLLTLLFLSPVQTETKERAVSLLQTDTCSFPAIIPVCQTSEGSSDSQADEPQATVDRTHLSAFWKTQWNLLAHTAIGSSAHHSFRQIRAPPVSR